MSERRDAFATRAVHAGLSPDPAFGSVIPAIHQTSTFAQSRPGEFVDDYDYARSANPTRMALERALGELEGGSAVTFASGLAAEHALLTVVCEAGSHIVLPADLYGGTYRLVDKVMARWGLEYDLVDQTDPDALERVVRDDTRLIWVEVDLHAPSSSDVLGVDVKMGADGAHGVGLPSIGAAADEAGAARSPGEELVALCVLQPGSDQLERFARTPEDPRPFLSGQHTEQRARF